MSVISKTGQPTSKNSRLKKSVKTFIQSSDLYFLSIHAILLESDHIYVVMKKIHSFTTCRNVALSYSELLMIIKSRVFYVLGHIISNIFASLWAKTVKKLKTVLTGDGRLPVS